MSVPLASGEPVVRTLRVWELLPPARDPSASLTGILEVRRPG